MRRDHFYAGLGQFSVSLVGVVGIVANQGLDRFFHKDFCERLLNQRYFMRVALSVQTAIGRPRRSATAIILVPLPRLVLPTPRRGFRVGTDSGRRFLKRQ